MTASGRHLPALGLITQPPGGAFIYSANRRSPCPGPGTVLGAAETAMADETEDFLFLTVE